MGKNASWGGSIGHGGSGPINTKSVGLSQGRNWEPVSGVNVHAQPTGWGTPPPMDGAHGHVSPSQSTSDGDGKGVKTAVTAAHGKGGKTTGNDR